jgi:hypothetical protein
MQQKTIWKAFSTIGISILIFFFSCNKTIDGVKTISYIYKNQSGIDLVMEVYNSDDSLFRSFTIANDSETITNTTTSEVPGVFNFNGVGNTFGDSVIVRFIDGKCISYSRSTPDKIFDIKKYDNYSEELLSNSKYSLIFIISNEDYLSADSCK